MGRLSWVLRLSVLLLAAGEWAFSQQPSTASGTTVIVMGSQTPLPSAAPVAAPPMIALPGSGTPIGAPVQVGVNDPRGGTGYVEQTVPAAGTPESYIVSAPKVAVMESVSAPAVATNAPSSPLGGNAGFRGGVGNVIGAARRSNSSLTVADTAAQFKARKGSLRSRQITNKDILALKRNSINNGRFDATTESLPQSDVTGDVGDGSQGVLDQKDLDLVNAALARSQAKQAAREKEQAGQPESGTQPANPKL